MSELFEKQMNAQKEKNFQGSRKLCKAHEKVCNENETNKQTKKKKWHAHKNIIDQRKHFIQCI